MKLLYRLNTIAICASCAYNCVAQQNSALEISATGTGRTTGHIATLIVSNRSDKVLHVLPQTFYIPSDGKYQSYIGRIPEGTTVPPLGSADIPIAGFCTDVSKPPIPSGESMPPSAEWVPVGSPPPPGAFNPTGANPVSIFPEPPVPPFAPSSIPEVTNSDGFTPGMRPHPGVIPTWPGTGDPVGGVFNPAKDPHAFAPVIVEALELIEHAADSIIKTGTFKTPFSNDPARERESIVQQSLWIFSAVITGGVYRRDDFANNVYEQFKDNTGVAVSALPEERREQVDAGIDDFWKVFQATGVEAKVLSAESPGLTNLISANPNLVQEGSGEDTPPAEAGPAECDCDELTFTVTVAHDAVTKSTSMETVTEFTASSSKPHKVSVNAEEAAFRKETDIGVTDIKLKCTNCRTVPCHPYAPPSDGKESKMTDDTKDKILVSGISINGAKETADTRETTGTSLSLTVTPDAKSANYFATFKISGTCMAPECKEEKCIRFIRIEVKQTKEKK